MKKIALIALAAAIAAILAGCDTRDPVQKALDSVDPKRVEAFRKGLDTPVSVFPDAPDPTPDMQAIEDAIARGVERGIRNAGDGESTGG